MGVRAKFTCGSAQKLFGPDGLTQVGLNVNFYPVWGDGAGNKSWSEATPSGNLNMYISNPAVFGAFESGKEYYLDITPVQADDSGGSNPPGTGQPGKP